MSVRRRRDIWDVAVIGGGIGGLSAALQAAARGLACVLIERALPGGLVATVNVLQDWPAGAAESGPELAARLAAQARAEDVCVIDGEVRRLAAADALWTLLLDGRELRARRVVCASGARLRPLGVADEGRFHGKGWSQCAWCDGTLFRGRDVAVIGGGDSALQQALVLAPLVRSVSVVARNALRARHTRIEAASACTNLRFVWGSTVGRLIGDEALEAIELVALADGRRSELACSGVFPFIGLDPQADYLPQAAVRDRAGQVVTDAELRTSLPAVYAIGALRAGHSGELTGAAGDAATAIASIARELLR